MIQAKVGISQTLYNPRPSISKHEYVGLAGIIQYLHEIQHHFHFLANIVLKKSITSV